MNLENISGGLPYLEDHSMDGFLNNDDIGFVSLSLSVKKGGQLEMKRRAKRLFLVILIVVILVSLLAR